MGEETASWKDRRARKVQKLVTTLEQALVLPDGGRRIALTGSLVGCTNLRSNKSKEIFRVIVRASSSDEMLGPNDYDKRERFWTKKTVEEAIRIMVTRNNLNPRIQDRVLNGQHGSRNKVVWFTTCAKELPETGWVQWMSWKLFPSSSRTH